jgi:hypothetical protein
MEELWLKVVPRKDANPRHAGPEFGMFVGAATTGGFLKSWAGAQLMNIPAMRIT